MNTFIIENKKYLSIAVVVLVFIFIFHPFVRGRYGFDGDKNSNTISVSGHGEVQAVPDIANVYFTISKDAKTVKEAQDAVAKIEASSLDLLKTNKIAEKDIKTQNASFYPKYEWKSSSSPVCMMQYCPPGGSQVIVGYTASESITVKVRNTDDAGKIMQGLGTLGVSDLSGPNFSIDDENVLKVEARAKAILDAKTKAVVLAKDLGVHLGQVTSFNENGISSGPMMYGKAMMEVSAPASLPAQIPKGENTISSDVTITYEIR
jgi:hypothetical protein